VNYPLVALKDCCEVIGGATPKRNIPEYWGNDIPWVTPKDVSNMSEPVLDDAPEYISQAGYDGCSTYLLPKGAILLTSRAPIGNVAIVGREMCTNQGFKSLIPGKDVDSLYLYYGIKNNSERLKNLGNGATFKEVSKKIVESFEIPLPPLKEQRRIAAILDKADTIRRKRQRTIELTETFLRSMFLDMFGDPVTNPKEWKMAELGSVAQIASGVTKGRRFRDKETVLVPYMRVANVQDGHIDISDVADIEVLKSDIKKYALEDGDILLTEGGDPDKLGRGAVWEGWISPCIHQNHIFKVRVNQDFLLPEFANAIIGSDRGKRYFLRSAKQTTGIASINMTQLKGFPILIPPRELQAEYVEIVTKQFALSINFGKALSEHDDLFNSLSKTAFKGELTQSATLLEEAISA